MISAVFEPKRRFRVTGTVLALWEELSENPGPRSFTSEVVTVNNEEVCQPD
jgi:hypothetical protein